MKKSLILLYTLIVTSLFSNLSATIGADPSYEDWVEARGEKLKHKSKIAQTAYGPIEYVQEGFGSVILCLHGAPGGYDQSYLIGHKLIHKGFTILAVSRPGYLQTPITVGQTPEAQADALVGLLDTLGIQKVAVLGFSTGGTVAYQFALRHPDRTWALVLESIGGNPASAPIYSVVSDLVLDEAPDLSAWLVYLSTQHNISATARWMLPIDNLLDSSENKKRINHVLKNKKQMEFLHDLVMSTLPISLRSIGLQNDLMNGNPWPFLPHALVTTPTYIIQSKDDSNGGYADADSAARNIPGAQLANIQQSGHFIWLGKNAKKSDSKLVSFLKKHQPKKKKK